MITYSFPLSDHFIDQQQQQQQLVIVDEDLKVVLFGNDAEKLCSQFKNSRWVIALIRCKDTDSFYFVWWEGSKLDAYTIERFRDIIPISIQSLCTICKIESAFQICKRNYYSMDSIMHDINYNRYTGFNRLSPPTTPTDQSLISKLKSQSTTSPSSNINKLCKIFSQSGSQSPNINPSTNLLPQLKNGQWFMYRYDRDNIVTAFHGLSVNKLQSMLCEKHSTVVLYKKNDEEFYFIIWDGTVTRPIEKCKFASFTNNVYLYHKDLHRKLRIVRCDSSCEFDKLVDIIRTSPGTATSCSSSSVHSTASTPGPVFFSPTPSTCSTPDSSQKIFKMKTTPGISSTPSTPSTLRQGCTDEKPNIIQNVPYFGYDAITLAMEEFNAGKICWLLIGYTAPGCQGLGLLAKGPKGMNEMKKHLKDESTAFGIIRVTYTDERAAAKKDSQLQKTMFVQWLGKKSRALEKSRRNTHMAPVYRLFQEKTVVHGEMEADEINDLEDVSILQKLLSFRNDIQFKKIIEA
ncbi:putative actin binding protein [Cavenderia fasciculata]|uniref:Actin binding protein n=1 Tax=Cavenderia fasciculata TaxID=261658 RepID=F4QE43_CACFS|nr:putative actin binding protein [Cavenderia fasciculata]EGG13990.1 putative actin binding protein [Cavenderia fasciculata]|eukprot:XP_004350698.1 putative actin binding protein [Cavenderia fasciculata]